MTTNDHAMSSGSNGGRETPRKQSNAHGKADADGPTLNPQRRVTRVPSIAWLFCLVALGFTALVGQGWGLHALMDLSTSQAEWQATQKQRNSLVTAWEAELRKHELAAKLAKEEAERARTELRTAQADRDTASAGLAGVMEELRLRQKARDQALATKASAETETAALRKAYGLLQREAAELQKSKLDLETRLAELRQDANQQADHAATLKTLVATLRAQQADAEKARDEAQGTCASERQRERQASAEARDAEKWRDAALRELADAKAESAKLKEQLTQRDSVAAELTRLTAAIKEFREANASLSATVTRLDQDVVDKRKLLAAATGELAVTAEKRRAADAQLATLRATLAKVKGETEAARADRDKAVRAQARIQKTIEGLRQQEEGLVSLVKRLAEGAIRSLQATTRPASTGATGKEN